MILSSFLKRHRLQNGIPTHPVHGLIMGKYILFDIQPKKTPGYLNVSGDA